ncbi:hypothetical protein ES708_16587 [subsurface metagenome]
MAIEKINHVKIPSMKAMMFVGENIVDLTVFAFNWYLYTISVEFSKSDNSFCECCPLFGSFKKIYRTIMIINNILPAIQKYNFQ